MKQVQRQQLQQKLSPQQIQLMRLLQLPVTDLEQAIKEEVEKNPLLEAMMTEEQPLPEEKGRESDWDISDDEEFDYDYREHQEHDPNTVHREFVVNDTLSSTERLLGQLSLRSLTERQQIIATEIIGTLDNAGYLSRDLALIGNDLAFRQGIEASDAEMEEGLHIVQSLDPPGIGARNLRECLLLQLERKESEDTEHSECSNKATALAIVRDHFDDFAGHRYERICAALAIDETQFEAAADTIRHLNPKPGGSSEADTDTATAIIPDIILTQHDGQLQFCLNDSHLPKLSLDEYYTQMLHEMEVAGAQRAVSESEKKTIQFLRAKQTDAQGFIDLLQLRHDTIVRVMRYIVKHQRQFLLSGNPDMLVPLRQREVAEATGLDISTVSRMANSKYLQTDFGTIALKECFSKGMTTEDGEEVAIETIKQRLSEVIAQEDKQSPLSDDALAKILNEQGLPLARRTVAKYREQLGIPVARLRRLIVLLLLLSFPFCLNAQTSYYDSIISVRLEASRNVPTAKKASVKTQTTVVEKPDKAVVKQTTTENSPAAKVESSVVPLWYDAFPHNRVNPLGRTRVDMLPDEINLLLIRDSADFCFPVKGVKSSPYGWRWHRGHHGVDIALRTGEPIHAAFGGTVRIASRMGGYGNCVVVRHTNGLETLYGHLSKINVHANQQVDAGDIIGLGGNTGNSTGSHLHFECRFLYQTFDPEWILDFKSHGLRTRRLHLDKSYFGIRQPRKGESIDYKADGSIIREGKKRPKNQPTIINPNDF